MTDARAERSEQAEGKFVNCTERLYMHYICNSNQFLSSGLIKKTVAHRSRGHRHIAESR